MRIESGMGWNDADRKNKITDGFSVARAEHEQWPEVRGYRTLQEIRHESERAAYVRRRF